MLKIEPIPFPGPVTLYLPDHVHDCTPVDLGKPHYPRHNTHINVLTVDRAGVGAVQHVFQTLASMLLGGYEDFREFIHLHVGQGSPDYLKDISSHHRLVVHSYEGQIKPHANLVLNWMRSITSLDEDYLFLEDDVICLDNWWDMLLDNRSELFRLGYDQFVLSLDRPSHTGFSRKSVAVGSKAAYTGTFGIFLTAKAIAAVFPHILGEFQYWERNPTYPIALDMSMKYAMIRSATKLFHCDPALVKHIGKICSLTGGKTATLGVSTEDFGKDVPDKNIFCGTKLFRPRLL